MFDIAFLALHARDEVPRTANRPSSGRPAEPDASRTLQIFAEVGSLGFILTRIFASVLFACGGVLHAAAARNPPRVSVAAAANLVFALDALNAAFRDSEPTTAVITATGASGSLVAQIAQGAPYDVFLSADLEYPAALIDAGHAARDSLTPFATGRLVVWVLRPGIPTNSVSAVMTDQSVRKVAIANLDTAPYGRAAREVLQRIGLWKVASAKAVYGENITQTAQFVESGSADAGFVALSLVRSPRLRNRGRWLLVPADMHTPLVHGAVLTRRGEDNPAAKRYLDFLGSDTARQVLAEYGYGPPP